MAAQKKRGKNGYINDFRKLDKGGFAYTGRLWKADEKQRGPALIKLWILQAAMFPAAFLPGFLTTAGLLNTFYVILPYVFWVISVFVLAYTLGGMTFGGNPMRDYVYQRTVERYEAAAIAPLTGAALTALGLLFFLIKNEGMGEGNGAVLCFVCCGIQTVLSVMGRKVRLREIWKLSENCADEK